MKHLFSSLQISKLVIKNRLVMPPMCMYSSDDTGQVKPFHRQHYASRALGGVGAIVLEATAVERRGRISANDLGIWSDDHIQGLSELAHTVKSYGAAAGIQLAHAGRKCGVEGEDLIAPSALQFDHHYAAPREMTEVDIEAVVEAFKHGARRAYQAGFDFVEIHAAHGYLINSFISPLTNHRQDSYGMTTLRGMTFLKRILTAVKKQLPEDYPVWVRISAEEYDAVGNHAKDWALKLEGLDDLYSAIHVSSGGVIPVTMEPHPGYQIDFAAIIKTSSSKPVIAGGLITEPETAHVIVSTGQADAVFLGRELLRNPMWPLQAAKRLGIDVDWPEPYARAK